MDSPIESIDGDKPPFNDVKFEFSEDSPDLDLANTYFDIARQGTGGRVALLLKKALRVEDVSEIRFGITAVNDSPVSTQLFFSVDRSSQFRINRRDLVCLCFCQDDEFVASLSGSTMVNVTVRDAFNNPLQFQEQQYTVTVSPDASIHSALCIIYIIYSRLHIFC
jgi:hypothetical protein